MVLSLDGRASTSMSWGFRLSGGQDEGCCLKLSKVVMVVNKKLILLSRLTGGPGEPLW